MKASTKVRSKKSSRKLAGSGRSRGRSGTGCQLAIRAAPERTAPDRFPTRQDYPAGWGAIVRSAQRDEYRLGLGVLRQSLGTLLAPVPGLLVSTGGERDVQHAPGVDPDHARPQPRRDLMCPADLRRVQPGRETVRCAVGQRHRLVLGVERLYRQHRPENLLLYQWRALVQPT